MQTPEKYQKEILINILSSTEIKTGKAIMKLDIKEPVIEYDFQKEKPEMIDLSPEEIKEDVDVIIVKRTTIVNASIDIK